MEKTKKRIVALLAIFAVSATAVAAASLSRNYHSAAAFADETTVTDETALAGSEENPVAAEAGVNTIDKMVVGGNAEMGYKELVYYMTFTPANSGVYSFTQSNMDVGVGNIYSQTEAPFGEYNDDWTVYSVELTKDVEYTVIINNFNWMIDLTDNSVGTYYDLEEPATITIAYASAAAGSSLDNALPYTVGSTIIVPEGHDPVWYSFEATGENYYLIALGGSAVAYEEFFGDINALANANSGYSEFSYDYIVYICATPTSTTAAEVQILVKDEQTTGSCIVTAETLPADGVVGGGKWYGYTAESNGSVSLTPTADAVTVEDDNGIHKLSCQVSVYDGYTFIGTLSDGVYAPAVLPETEEGEEVPAYTGAELVAGKTYHFYAENSEYVDGDGNAVVVLAKLVIE